MDKHEVLEKLIDSLKNTLSSTQKARKREHEEMISAPSMAVSRSDTTRSQKEGIIFELDKRIHTIKENIKRLSNIEFHGRDFSCKVGSLVVIEYNNEIKHIFILPCAGGEVIQYQNVQVNVTTLDSPITKSIINKSVGDEFKVYVKNSVNIGYIEEIY